MNLIVVNNVDYWASFLAGLLSFFTPCILPIIPGFIAYFISKKDESAKKALVNSIGFVLGLSTVFVNMGFLSGYMGGFLSDNKVYLNIIGGTIIVIFGLYTMEVINLPFIGKMSFSSSFISKKTFVSSFILGLTFSLVWSPCLSPTLGSILVLSSQSGRVLKGGIYLTLYSLGFAIPFVLSAILIEKFSTLFDKIQRTQKYIESITGIILVAIGTLMVFGVYDKILK